MTKTDTTDDNTRHGLLIRDLADDDKPREKALKNGISTLSDSELLAIIFATGLRGMSVLELSQSILMGVDYRIDRLAQLSIHEMTSKYKGVGTAKATTLSAAIELGRRCQRALQERAARDAVITDSNSAYQLMRHELELLDYEEFWILHLNRSNRVTFRECLSKGGIAGTLVDIKLLMKKTIDKLSSGLILVHNHPSGNPKPSAQDDALTRKIVNAAALFDINVLDHLIITPSGYYSYRDQGKI
ncbi:MAG: DNA repair protein RadC [Muribaculaceae bacterium]|nr:DNA repair protein RadC [Muribaculaceae bacterium]